MQLAGQLGIELHGFDLVRHPHFYELSIVPARRGSKLVVQPDFSDRRSRYIGQKAALFGERPNAGQAIGFAFTLAGGIATSLLRDNGSSTASAATKGERDLPDNT